MMVSRIGVNGVRVHPRQEHQRAAHDHAHARVKTEAKVVKEHETRQQRAVEISVREVSPRFDILVFLSIEAFP